MRLRNFFLFLRRLLEFGKACLTVEYRMNSLGLVALTIK